MQLQEFFDYKNQLMKDMLTSKAIVSLLDENTPVDRGIDLAYTHVFPYEFVPDTVQDGRTFICFDVDIQGIDAPKTFLYPILYIWTCVHKSKLRLPEGGVRSDRLCSEICKLINGSRMYSLGELHLYSVKRFAPMTDYNGKVLAFHGKDFSKQYDPQRYIPENRKTG